MVMSKAIKATGAAMASIVLTLSMAPLAFADQLEEISEGSGEYKGNSTLEVEIKPTMVDMTIPTVSKAIIDENGTAYTADLEITNNSKAPMKMNLIFIQGTDGWQVTDDRSQGTGYNKKMIGFQIIITDKYGSIQAVRDEEKASVVGDGIYNTRELIAGEYSYPIAEQNESMTVKLTPDIYSTFTQPTTAKYDLQLDFQFAV